MANINNTTADIVVRVAFDSDSGKNDTVVLSFMIEDEYHLKKLSVGAYAIKVISSPHLKHLYKNHYYLSTISCGKYTILCNLVENGEYDINAIMFNHAETKLIKNDVLFKIKMFAVGTIVAQHCSENDSDEIEYDIDTNKTGVHPLAFKRKQQWQQQSELKTEAETATATTTAILPSATIISGVNDDDDNDNSVETASAKNNVGNDAAAVVERQTKRDDAATERNMETIVEDGNVSAAKRQKLDDVQ
ncbi:tlp20 [Catopsilia pomona nucleopolyhedrovirus]|uniref:Tlp20 n=1 Tax=Catopsilia pomona nucleopolyhedrovirus TaxID=1850906 RepID=A0A172WZC7_9ABAC|nr:tlp20 [Catopsilia pomona nucleopolyhedrovirus]ANF29708.1 tlp20 [Catopsilia pomona nucleopolyhedrovirus]